MKSALCNGDKSLLIDNAVSLSFDKEAYEKSAQSFVATLAVTLIHPTPPFIKFKRIIILPPVN